MNLAAKTRRRLVVLAALAALYAIAGFLVLPPIIRSQVQERLSTALGRRVTVERVRVNPFALSLTLEGFAIKEKDGQADFLGWRRLYVRAGALSSLWREWVLSEVALDGFSARVTVNPDQSLNFSDLLAKLAPPGGAAAPPPRPARAVRVARLRVAGARVDFSDLSLKRQFATTIGPLTFAATDVRTASESGAPYRFEAVTESGEKLAFSGTLEPAPFRSAGELRLENILLPKYSPYYGGRVKAEVADGRLTVEGRYEIDLTEGRRTLKLTDGALHLLDFRLLERGHPEAAVELPAFDIEGVQADALSMKASVRSVRIAGGHIRVRRDSNGSVNLLAMLPAPAAGPASPAAPAPGTARPPEVAIGELVLHGLQVTLSDLAAPRPAELALGDIEASLRNISLAEGAQMPLKLSFSWAPKGAVSLEGSVGIRPVKADLRADVKGLEILPLSPYLEQFVNAKVTQGAVTSALDVQVALPEGKPFAATLSGDVRVVKLGLVDGAHNEDLAGFGELTLRGLHAGTAPELGVSLDELDLTGPYARVVVAKDKSLNLSGLVRSDAHPAPPGGAAPGQPATAPAKAPPRVQIARIVVRDGDARFTDNSLVPGVSVEISQFGGTISGLSSANVARGDVDLKATVDGSGPVAIAGKLDPLGAARTIDLRVDAKNVDLLPLGPYSEKFAGYELSRGKLALDIKLQVEGEKIDASNIITLEQFTFGNPVASADATALPVRLGVALLKDMDGRIVINVPVQGSIDDPSFRIGRVVMRVIVNLLTKAAVSPFALLGSAFGGGGDELAYQEFAPGSSQIQPGEVAKLKTLAKALANRPGLSLGIEGSYDAVADTYAIRRAKLADRVRRAVWDAKHLADPNIAPPSELVIAPGEYAAQIKRLFDEKFPPGTQFGTPLPPAPHVVAPPPPPAGFLERLVRAITFQALREQRAAQQENARLAAKHGEEVKAALAAGLPTEEMSGRLAEAETVDDNDLRAMAQARALRVRDYFAREGSIAPERLFLTGAKAGEDAAKAGKGPRVFLQLQ